MVEGPKRMETLREFLDSSTIHGLSHISNPKVRLIFLGILLFLQSQTNVPAKISWFITVLIGFVGAFYLIHDWQESPILTAITVRSSHILTPSLLAGVREEEKPALF